MYSEMLYSVHLTLCRYLLCGLFVMFCEIWYHLYNLKREKHPWRSVTFSKAYNFTKTLSSNGLVVKALDSQSRGPVFKTTGWLQGRLSLSSLQGR